jgi:hypothetical protein
MVEGRGTGDPGVAYLVFVAWQVHCEIAVPCVPHFQGAVLATCDEQSAVGRPGALVYLGMYVRRVLIVGSPVGRWLTGAT